MIYVCILWKEGFPGGASGKEHACQCRRRSDLVLHVVKRRGRHGNSPCELEIRLFHSDVGKVGFAYVIRNSEELNT